MTTENVAITKTNEDQFDTRKSMEAKNGQTQDKEKCLLRRVTTATTKTTMRQSVIPPHAGNPDQSSSREPRAMHILSKKMVSW